MDCEVQSFGIRTGAGQAAHGPGSRRPDRVVPHPGFAHNQQWEILLGGAIGGLGFGIALSALSAHVVNAVPHSHTSAAAGMNANIRTVGGATGAAIVATVLGSRTGASGVPSEHGWVAALTDLSVAAAVDTASCLLIPRTPSSAVGPGAGEVMMSDGRAQDLPSTGFPVGCATSGDLGQVIPFPFRPLRSRRNRRPAWQQPRTGLPPTSDDELTGQSSTTHPINHQSLLDAQEHTDDRTIR